MKQCKVSKKCGGCQYLDTPYETQLQIKKDFVQKLFPKVKVHDTLGMKDPYHYRHKVYFAFGYDQFGKVKAGLFAEKSHNIVFTDVCLIQHIQANHIIKDLCDIATKLKISPYDEDRQIGVLRYGYIRISHATGDILLTIVIGSKELPKEKTLIKLLLEKHPEIKTIILNYNHGTDSMVLGKREKVLYGKGYIFDTIGNLTFKISSKSFYQVNPVQTEVLYKTAIDLASIQPSDNVLDVCCGIGTISLLAAQKANFVLGVEINPQAIQDAKANAKANHIKNIAFEAMDAEKFIECLMDTPDIVFLDPPRTGLTENFLHTLGKLNTPKIIYISCNPITQARDIEVLKKYHYVPKEIYPVDNFAFTKHTETVVLMSRK